MFNRQHTQIGNWCAHDHLILASSFTSLNGKELYITGGNDGCVVVWDVSVHSSSRTRGKISSNGLFSASRLDSRG